MEAYKIINSSSRGNSVVIFDSILVDVGVPFNRIKNIVNDLKLITWSHCHFDHFNKSTISKIISMRPTIRVAVCEHERERAISCGAKNIDILKHGTWYDYGEFQIATFKTYHDVPSNGWRFKNDDYKIFFATDTAFLTGITAKGYTHYLIEHNYNAETVIQSIEEKEARGEYAHQRGAINSHLSEQQARDFIFKNMKEDSQIVRLHESQKFI
jgi:L-ascorbate metabolism protein UlaG (beta-lactamase superfamily)